MKGVVAGHVMFFLDTHGQGVYKLDLVYVTS